MCHITRSVQSSLTHTLIDDQHFTSKPFSFSSLSSQPAFRYPVLIPQHIPVHQVSAIQNILPYTQSRHYHMKNRQSVIPLRNILLAPAQDAEWFRPGHGQLTVPKVGCDDPPSWNKMSSVSQERIATHLSSSRRRDVVFEQRVLWWQLVAVFPYRSATRSRISVAHLQFLAAEAKNRIGSIESWRIRGIK